MKHAPYGGAFHVCLEGGVENLVEEMSGERVGGRVGEPDEHHQRPQMGMFMVFWWNKCSQT